MGISAMVCVCGGKVREQLRVHSLIHLYMGSGTQIMLPGLRREPLNLLSHVGGNWGQILWYHFPSVFLAKYFSVELGLIALYEI